tara:strand:- start:227 stop:754 length:528 start_codon:yes stop_codon:yes gene_type:complete
MPSARKVIFSTYVVPTFSIEMEETAITHTELQTSPGKTLGGKGSATINATQWGDEWTSMEHAGLSLWEDFTDVFWEDFTSNWETAPKGEVTINATLSDNQLSSDSNDLAFLYIKNTGDTEVAGVSLTGSSGTRVIYIPPGGSVHLRGDGTALECNEVYVRAESNTTTIEYIIAKE